MKKHALVWDGKHLPEALKKAPPGRYVLQVVEDEDDLTDEQDAGLREALDQLDAGDGHSLASVIKNIEKGSGNR